MSSLNFLALGFVDDDLRDGDERPVDDEPDESKPVNPGNETDRVKQRLLCQRKMAPKVLQLDAVI